jgi:hypothetical protein
MKCMCEIISLRAEAWAEMLTREHFNDRAIDPSQASATMLWNPGGPGNKTTMRREWHEISPT